MLPARLSAAPQPAAAPSESTTPAATSLIAQVVFDVPLDRHFDYQTVPLAVGQRVRAGFAGRQLTGLVVGMADSSPSMWCARSTVQWMTCRHYQPIGWPWCILPAAITTIRWGKRCLLPCPPDPWCQALCLAARPRLPGAAG